jgi:hypothetical protein
MEQETIYVPPTQRAIDHAIINSVGMAVAMSVIGLRLSVRHYGIGNGWDDGLMVVGFVSVHAATAFQCSELTLQLASRGRNLWNRVVL